MLQFNNKKLVLAGVVAAIMLTGCGKKTPTGVARPVPLGDSAIAPAPTAPQNLDEIAPVEGELPTYEDATTEPVDPATPNATEAEDEDAAEDEKAAEEAAKKAEDEAAAKKAAEEAAKKAAEDAKQAEEAAKRKKEEEEREAEEEAQEQAEKLARQTPKFSKAIGAGSLHSANGITIAGGILYVVDNARQGLLGKFAAIRSYDLATGDFQSSIENIGWAGAKNLPTSVNRVKLDGGNLVAADGAKSYKFSLTGELLESVDATFPLPTEVEADDDVTYRIKNGQIDRLDEDGDVVLSFGDDELDAPVSITLDEDGNIYVSESASAKVVVFSAPED